VVAKLSSQDADIVRAAAQFFHILIHGDAEGVLDSKIFARSLTDLVRKYISNRTIPLDERIEEDLVERLFEVSTKIKLDPDILPAWFYPERDRSRTRDAVGEARKNQFPLFYLLVEYVHHDGSTGDFARTGLLYLTETASRSKPLEQWMIESDLAPQMASGLGALYSRLSRRLPEISEGEKIPPIIALSDSTITEDSASEITAASQQEVKAYLSYLAFWQDTLHHCSSQEVTDTLLDHFQVLFVQQLLYPSLLESSDVDGGSTASVLTHLFRTLDAIDEPSLVERILGYLLASPENSSHPSRKRQQRVSISRRKSMDKLAAFVEKTSETTPTPNLFTLTDLMVMSLKSQNSLTVLATLKLVSVITSKYHKYEALFRTCETEPRLRLWPTDVLTSELSKLLNLATIITNSRSIDQSYQYILNDIQTMLEQHSCTPGSRPETDDLGSPERQKFFTISGDCKIFSEVVDLFRTFFGNDTAINLALTEAIISIASCKHLMIQGWLLPTLEATTHVEKKPSIILTILTDHVEQIQIWRAQFPEWDELMALRKAELIDFGSTPTATANVRSVSGKSSQSQGSDTPSPSYAQPARIVGSQSSSRPTTPRGKQLPKPEFGSIDSTLSASPARTLATSPLHQMFFASDSMSEAGESDMEDSSPSFDTSVLLQTQVTLPYESSEEATLKPNFGSLVERMKIAHLERGSSPSTNSGFSSGAVTPSRDRLSGSARTSASLSHVLTNAVILQEFVLEIAAVAHVRASLFGEVQVL
jgi:Retinoic acid induced 16-like protein/Family of unknown function (DUF5917)